MSKRTDYKGKEHKAYYIKNVGFKMEDIDESKRKVVGYLSTFNQMDSDRDIIRMGAFAKSIAEHGPQSASNRKIQYLRYHNWDWQIGRFDELAEDEKGLRFVGTLSQSQAGLDALMDYREGVIREHSIGFNYIWDKLDYVEDEDGASYYEVREVQLWEGSAVTFGANPYTNVVEVAKSKGGMQGMQLIDERMNTIRKAIKNGSYSDGHAYKLEKQLAILQEQMKALISTQPSIEEIKASITVPQAKEDTSHIDKLSKYL